MLGIKSVIGLGFLMGVLFRRSLWVVLINYRYNRNYRIESSVYSLFLEVRVWFFIFFDDVFGEFLDFGFFILRY